MIRLIGIALVIWGLIVQPLMAAMPAPITDESSHSIAMADSGVMAHPMGHHGSQDAKEQSKAPCHEKTADSASSESCDNCDVDCMNGICGSSCVMSGATAFQKSSVNLDLFSSSLVAASSGARAHGLPSRIFHPPKHA
ncbi:hypothetical protein [Maricurvus nonylphenolicus]|jgi:hypothetical protein|uniref:hypothetical protein n=1 Tax=Maricurvus nonylphenolicus TaxID=1008307 RepID=UPI0036F3BC16